MDEDEPDLTEIERRALRELPAETRIPSGLEDRVVEALRSRALLPPRDRRPAASRRFTRWAAAAVLFAAGVAAGRLAGRVPAPRPPDGSLYLLLLFPGPAYVQGGPADEAARVEEYRAWAGGLRREGRLVGAEKLKAGAAQVLEGASGVETAEGPQGFFLVRARDPAQARAIAGACPHLRHGGRVTVQAVDPT